MSGGAEQWVQAGEPFKCRIGAEWLALVFMIGKNDEDSGSAFMRTAGVFVCKKALSADVIKITDKNYLESFSSVLAHIS